MPDDLDKELVQLAARVVMLPGWRRIRIAITPAERKAIKARMLNTCGVYYQRFLDIPLVVEKRPLDPPLKVERHKPVKSGDYR